LENQHLEPFILPPLGLSLLAQLLQYRQSCGWVSLGQVYPGLAERETVRLRQVSGGRQIALAQQRQHLRGSNLRDAIHKVLLASGLIGLSQKSGRAGDISLGQFQVGKKHLTANKSVNHSFILLRQMETLSPVRESCLQVIPFVEDTCQAKIRFADNLKRLVTCQLEDALIGLG